MFTTITCSQINKATDNFFTRQQVSTATFLISAAYLLVRYKNFRFVTPVACAFLFGLNLTNVNVHPLTSGLSSVLENPLVVRAKEIREKDPGAKWAVFGSQPSEGSNRANLLKASGVNVFNGVKWIPNSRDIKAIDITVNDSVYNRYAHVDLHSNINYRDTVIFQLMYYDGYAIHLDPCSPRLTNLGIKYFVFTYKPGPEEIRCMTPIDTVNNFIYKRNDL